MYVTEEGITMEVRAVHLLNNHSEILSSEEIPANVTEVRPVQSKNASIPMLVTEEGIVKESKLVHPRNA